MALSNYTDLQASVLNWLHKTNDATLTAAIPDIITLAEKRINGDLDARLQDTVVTLSTVASTISVASPTDVIDIRSLVIQSNPNEVLDYLTPDQFNTQYAFGETGKPRSFAVIGTLIYLGPTPDAIYSIQCVYKAMVPALSTTGTNWLMTNFPQVYLMASLATSVLFTVDDERIPKWEKAYADAIKSVNSTDWYSGSTMRIRSDVRL